MADFELPGYELYERLGRGGMATVYRALHLNLDREVAIKVMDPSMSSDENFSERFIREARISARLTHPHILQIYDVNAYDGFNFIAMELLGAGELADFIHSDMPQKQIYTIVEQMTEALDYAAGRGYVHRDIKPSNIMRRAEEDFVLADFGIARAANSGTQMTQTGLMVGTPSYMSPEQAKGQEVDGRSDIYALAVLIYEMLTKTLPYESESAVTTAVKHLTEDIPTLPDHLSAYQEFINKGLAKKADDRFQTGSEMHQAFKAASAGFADDDVLTPGSEAPKAPVTADHDRTSLAAGDSTRLSQSDVPALGSRPYRLDGTSQRERLVSGTYQKSDKAVGSSMMRFLLIGAVLAALGGGGYYFWQQQQGGAAKGQRSVTSELAAAYSAMNNDDLKGAARSFFKALQLDSGNAAAEQGMAEVGAQYEVKIEAALAQKELKTAASLFDEYSGYFAGSGSLERYHAEVELLKEQQLLATVQGERIQKLTEQAAQYVKSGDYEPARALIDKATAIDAAHPAVLESEKAFADARALALQREERWASFSEEDRKAWEDALETASEALEAGNLTDAEAALAEAMGIVDDDPQLQQLLAQLTEVQDETARLAAESKTELDQLLTQADEAAAAIPTDPGSAGTAVEIYNQVLEADPESEAALAGIAGITAYYLDAAQAAVSEGSFEEAAQILATAEEVVPEQDSVSELQQQLPELEQAHAQRLAEAQRQRELAQQEAQQAKELVQKGEVAISSGSLDSARRSYQELLAGYPEQSATAKFKEKLKSAYVAAAREEMDVKEFDAALDLVAQGKAVDPDDGQWATLEEEIESSRSSSRRRLGAY